MKKWRILAAVTLAVVALMGCSKSSGQVQKESEKQTIKEADSEANAEKAEVGGAEDKLIVLKLNHVQSNTDPVQEAFLQLSDLVKERSGGSIEIQVYANSELGSNKDNLEQVANGASIIAVGDTGFLADYVPDIGIMNGPFLYGSYDDCLLYTSGCCG